MKLPSATVFGSAGGSVGSISRAVEQSRRLGAPARVLIVGAVVAEVVFAALLPFKGITPGGLYFAAAGVALALGLTLLVLRRAWIRESQEPFRYTFWVGSFEPMVGADPQADGAQRLAALGVDLTKLLSERVGRLSLLEERFVDATRWDAGRSHVHMRGEYAVRRAPAADRVAEVRVWIRLGPPGQPETLAPRAEFTTTTTLDTTAYEQILERVYFSAASEIYRQIRNDVDDKIRLLPRGRLQAAAYFYEAVDYARSSTLDANAAARDLFQKAIELYDPTAREPSRAPVRRFLGLVGLGLWAVWCRVRRRLALLVAPRLAHPDVMLARARIGKARMLIYHQSLAGLSGQTVNSAFEACPLATRAGADLDAISMQAPTWKEARFNALVTEAHALATVGERDRAQLCLDRARQLAPTLLYESGEFLFVSALVEEHQISSLQLLRASVETGTGAIGELAQFVLAVRNEYLWRSRSTLEPSVGERIVEDYRALLRRNPGIVAAWGRLGYMLWLLDKPEQARGALERGRDYKDIKGATFVSELDYGLARLAADRGDFDRAYGHYIDAVSALLRSGLSGQPTNYLPYYFEFIGKDILDRFRRYVASVRKHLANEAARDSSRSAARIRESVLAFVLNDYGQASWSYYLRTGDEVSKRRAIVAFQSACARNPDFLLPRWNLFELHSWLGTETDDATARRHLQHVRHLDRHWSDGVLAEAEQHADDAWNTMREARDLRAKGDRIRSREATWSEVEDVRSAVSIRGEVERSEGLDTFEHAAPGVSDTERAELAYAARRLADEKERAAGKYRADGIRLVHRLLPHAWLSDVFAADRPEATTRAVVRLLRAKRVPWATDVTLLHVAALETWAKLVFSFGSSGSVVAATALMQHLQRHYWPSRLLDWQARAGFALSDTQTPRRVRRLAQAVAMRHALRWADAVAFSREHDERLARALVEGSERAVDYLDLFFAADDPWQRSCNVLNWRAMLWQYDDDRARLDWARWIAHELQELGLEREAMEVLLSARASGRESVFLANVAGDLFQLGNQSAQMAVECWEASTDAYRQALENALPNVREGFRLRQQLEHAVALWALAGAHEEAKASHPDVSDAYGRAVEALNVVARSTLADRQWRHDLVERLQPHVVSPRAHRELQRWLVRERDRYRRGTPERTDADESRRKLISTRLENLRARPGESAAPDQSAAMPLVIAASAELFPEPDDWWAAHPLFAEYIPAVRARVQREFGIRLPGVLVRVDRSLAEGEYVLSVDEVPLAQSWVPGTARKEWHFCLDEAACAGRGLTGVPASSPSGRGNGVWLATDAKTSALADGLPFWDHYRFLVEHLGTAICARLGALVGPDEVAAMLDRLARIAPETRTLADRIAHDDRRLVRLTRVVRSLLAERVPVVDLATILDAFDARRTLPVGDVVECIRQAVRETLPGRDGSLPLIGLDAVFESQLAGWTSAEKRTFLAVPREELSSIRNMLRRELRGRPAALVVRRPGLRPLVRGLIRLDLPDVPVLSRSEFQGTLPRIERTIGQPEEVAVP